MSYKVEFKNKTKRRRKLKGKGLNAKQKEQIKNMLDAPLELKYFDYTFNAYSSSLTPSFFDAFQPSQGTASNEIIGADVELKSINYKFLIAKADTTNYLRMVIFQWYGDSLTDSPNWNQLFQFHTAGVPADVLDASGPYLVGQGRDKMFNVITDREYLLDSDDSTIIIQGFINKGFRKRITFNDDNSPQTGVNHIYIMWVSDSGAVSHPGVTGYLRCRYYDA